MPLLPPVLHKVSFLCERFPTGLTTVRFLSSMNSLVFGDMGWVWKGSFTKLAGIGP